VAYGYGDQLTSDPVSVSMYRGQVDRLTKDIADLRSKLATANGKVADDRSKARRAGEAMDRTSNASTVRSKGREVERYEKSAVGHEKQAAQLEGQIASKLKSLNNAQGNLERAIEQQRKKEERETERHRKQELAHVRELERQRRSSQVWPEAMHVRPAADTPDPPTVTRAFDEHYDVCLSFAGEQRGYVELVAQGLKDAELRVFYDQDEDVAARLWGRDLTEYLDYVYRQGSRVCVMFISQEYAAKEWTRLERRSALDRALREAGEYILPARFDDTELPGLRPSVSYLDLREFAPATLVDFIVRKLKGD